MEVFSSAAGMMDPTSVRSRQAMMYCAFIQALQYSGIVVVWRWLATPDKAQLPYPSHLENLLRNRFSSISSKFSDRLLPSSYHNPGILVMRVRAVGRNV